LSNLWLLQAQQNNTLMGMPLSKGTQVRSNLQFQPLVPIRVRPHWNLISRPVMQVFSSQPYPIVTSVNPNSGPINSETKRSTGVGDMILATALSPDSSPVGNWILAAGTTFVFPTATQHVLGQDTGRRTLPLRWATRAARGLRLFSRSTGGKSAAGARRPIKHSCSTTSAGTSTTDGPSAQVRTSPLIGKLPATSGYRFPLDFRLESCCMLDPCR